jgi:hypothetical protein
MPIEELSLVQNDESLLVDDFPVYFDEDPFVEEIKEEIPHCCTWFRKLAVKHQQANNSYACCCCACRNPLCPKLNWIAECCEGLTLSSRFWYCTCGRDSSFTGRSVWGVLFPVWLGIMLVLVFLESIPLVLLGIPLLVILLILAATLGLLYSFLLCGYRTYTCTTRRCRRNKLTSCFNYDSELDGSVTI